MVDKPIEIAQSQARVINVQKGPEDIVKQKFVDEWEEIGADKYIANTVRLSRIYGISAIAIKVNGQKDDTPLDFTDPHRRSLRESHHCSESCNLCASG